MIRRKMYLRLDDAAEYMKLQQWQRMESLLDQYNIKPIFGIIPNCKDPDLVSNYELTPDFWDVVHRWIEKGWIPAMHGYEHVYVTDAGGINPVHKRSEFAGLPYEEQAEKIGRGITILSSHGIYPDVFFAPSHTFDLNTLRALSQLTTIRIISDSVAWDTYKKGSFFFVPVQSGYVRNLPFHTTTFCYHPNSMHEADFLKLDSFLSRHRKHFSRFEVTSLVDRKKTIVDNLLQLLYLAKQYIRRNIHRDDERC